MLTAINQQAHKLLPMKLAFFTNLHWIRFLQFVDIVQKNGVFLSYVQFHLLLAILFVDLSNLIVLV